MTDDKLDVEIEHCYVPRVWWDDLKAIFLKMQEPSEEAKADPVDAKRALFFELRQVFFGMAIEIMEDVESGRSPKISGDS